VHFHTENHIVQWIRNTVLLESGCRHPLVYLMEAADDISGLLEAYLPLMTADRARFDKALAGSTKDDEGRPIARDSSLVGRISRKYLAVYREAVRQHETELAEDTGALKVMERVQRMRLIVDHISGMTDEYALQSFQLISGVHVDPYRS
jgi:dGTPase